MAIKEKDKASFLRLIEARLIYSDIDWKELGNDSLGSPYRNLRPWGGDCECWGGTPEEEKEWHVTHLNKCVKGYKQLGELRESLWNLIVQEGERFKKEKKKVWKRIEEKARKLGFSDISGKWEIMNCTNKKLLKDKEDSKLAYLENLANKWQKNSEAEKERLKKEEEERIKQEQQKVQAEEAESRKQEEEIKQKEQEFKNQVEEERKQEPNPKSNEELNGLKNKFYELYQKEKKYNHHELMVLRTIIDKIKKETSPDGDIQDAEKELQTIWDKLTPHFSTIEYCRHLIEEEERNSEDKTKVLEKYQLEECKKALEEVEKIIYLSPWDEHLIKKINSKLKALDLEEEIRQLKNQNSTNQNPEQQAENKRKIEERERELKEIKKQSESEESKQLEISSQILSEFQSIPSFETNTKEKIESLINLVKNNSDFLLEIKTKYQVEDLNTLFTDKSPEDIITIIKRFEYDNLSSNDKENKDKEIRSHYKLKDNESLTEEQINKYLYKEATGKLESERNSIINQDEEKTNNVKFILPLLLLLLGVFLGLLIKKRVKNKSHANQDVWQAKDTKNYNIRISSFKNEIMKKFSNLIAAENKKDFSDYESEENELGYDSKNSEAFY